MTFKNFKQFKTLKIYNYIHKLEEQLYIVINLIYSKAMKIVCIWMCTALQQPVLQDYLYLCTYMEEALFCKLKFMLRWKIIKPFYAFLTNILPTHDYHNSRMLSNNILLCKVFLKKSNQLKDCLQLLFGK